MRVFKDGVVATSPTGYNSSVGNQTYSVMSLVPYETDYASTPYTVPLFYMDDATYSTASRTYAPAFTDSQFALNSTWASSGAGGYEQSVSTGVCHEIMV